MLCCGFSHSLKATFNRGIQHEATTRKNPHRHPKRRRLQKLRCRPQRSHSWTQPQALTAQYLKSAANHVIVSMDPITGAVERIGMEAINVNANDVATFGVEPAFFFSCIMLPEGADSKIIETISTQMGQRRQRTWHSHRGRTL